MSRTLPAVLAAAAFFVGLSATPAIAFSGRDAISQCTQRGAGQCVWTTRSDGSIRINTVEGQALHCASPAGACVMLYQTPRTAQLAAVRTVSAHRRAHR